ncbi:hypothetical protein BpHYR1_009999 [Brachionus plicatilis]|uniref:Uncharacterized protein n=1 Tax=Brachionus plicatilis TaxID=10195 RepID=A0A3M7PD62_BRAPC|nr:hypothetical protein BpHYR1_009999 [Brachionus plicatilis]
MRWDNFLKKGNKVNSSQEEVMLFEKVIDESRARMEKENNIVISGVPLRVDNGEDSIKDVDLVLNILEEILIQNPRTKMRRVSRLKKNPQLTNTKPPPLIVELCDKDTKLRVLKGAQNLKDSKSFNKCFINLDLTRNELTIKIELRKRRNLENCKLEQGDGRLKYETSRGKNGSGNSSLNCLYTNATSLVNKWDDFISLINTKEFPHLLMVTETWFNQNQI